MRKPACREVVCISILALLLAPSLVAQTVRDLGRRHYIDFQMVF